MTEDELNLDIFHYFITFSTNKLIIQTLPVKQQTLGFWVQNLSLSKRTTEWKCLREILRQKGTFFLALRRKMVAVAPLQGVKRFHTIVAEMLWRNKDSVFEFCVTVTLTRTKRQTEIILIRLGVTVWYEKYLCLTREHIGEIKCYFLLRFIFCKIA